MTNAENVGESEFGALVVRNFDTEDTSHSRLPLLLRVPGVLLANDAHDALAADDLALRATDLDGCPDFHRNVSLLVAVDDPSPRKIVGGQF